MLLGYVEGSAQFFTHPDARASKGQRSACWVLTLLASHPPLKPNRSLARAPWLYFRAHGMKTKCTRLAIIGVAVM
jgi:hypothetical protein